MSHTITVQAELRDQAALQAACTRMGLEQPTPITAESPVRLFDGTLYDDGLAIHLPDWRYPVVIRPEGSLAFDTYAGHWGDPRHLDLLKQLYAVEVTKRSARANGWRVTEITQPDGSIRLKLQ